VVFSDRRASAIPGPAERSNERRDRLREDDASPAERERLLGAVAESRRQTEDLRKEVEAANRRRAADAANLGRAYSILADACNELEKSRRSHLWYWRLREILRGRGGRRAADPGLGSSRPASPPAPGVPALYDVVCFPIIEWEFRFQRPQQLLSRFAAAGHRVFYLSHRFRRKGAPWEIVERGRNVFEVTLLGPRRNVYRSAPSAAAAERIFRSLDALRRDAAIGPAAALVQLPFWWPVVRRARRELAWPVVYDCMDLHTGFSTNSSDMVELEEDLLKSADLVAVSSALLESRARERNANVRMIRNACDYDHFASAPSVRHPRPVVGYYGAIADWFDVPLVTALARRCPDLDFVLVGSTWSSDVRALSRLPNVRLVGERPYDEIPGWLGAFDVAFIPFRRTPLTEATNPVKAYEIFAAGKPLVSVDLPELRAFDGLVRIAGDAASFEKEIRSALAEDPAAAQRRRDFARAHTWQRRYEELAPAIGAAFPHFGAPADPSSGSP